VESAPTLRLVVGGDAMLGRAVARRVHTRGARYPLGAIAPLMRRGDLSLVNLECAVTLNRRTWAGESKDFYFRAPPQAIDCLAEAGIGLVTLANNHVLDYGVDGLADTLAALDRVGIAHAGAGMDAEAALAPAIVERNGIRIGLSAFCDHQPDFAAGPSRPGISYLDLADHAAACDALRRALSVLQARDVDWPVLSLHWGPNWVEAPSPAFVELAHAAIDMGWGMLYGHSAHVFQGVELYRGAPILYGTGDLVDDYAVHPVLRNDRQMLFDLTLERERLQRLVLHPLVIDSFRVRPADEAAAAWIAARARERSQRFGATIHGDRELLVAA
jgi:poly-gamma-glutamate synthesis protein (capsule biosynthesis protein)